MQLSLGQDVRHLLCGRNLDEQPQHRTILDDFVSEVLPDVDVLGSFPSANDVVAPFNAGGVVLIYRGGLLLLESETVQKSPGLQNLTSSRRC